MGVLVNQPHLFIAMHFKLRSFAVLIFTALLIFSLFVLSHLYHYYYNKSLEEGTQRTEKRNYNIKEKGGEFCESIHIALVVGGYNTTKSTATLLKSLLFYNTNYPLHLHIIVDTPAHLILTVLLHTWQLPSLQYTLYPINGSLLREVQWIPNAHYSSVFGLLKLLLPYILQDIDSVIVLDTDVTILSDLDQLWRHFKVIRRNKKWLGLVENQSDWYRGTIWKEHKPWPALDRGFNTGVMLMDLQMLRRYNWANIWSIITNQTLIEYQYTALADQDIINTVIRIHPEIFHVLPCNWNLQLSEHMQSEYCISKTHQYNIIHWNSPLKTLLSNQYTSYFRNLYTAFVQFDGNLHRNKNNFILSSCSNRQVIKTYKSNYYHKRGQNVPCSLFVYEANQTYRTHLYYFGESYSPYDQHDITLVTQLSIDRIQNIHTLMRHWNGPLTLVIYCRDSDLYEIEDYFKSFPSFKKRGNLAVHIVYKQGHFYPINLLRNIGLQYSTTPYVFLMDIDFLPSFNLYNYLREAVKVLKLGTLNRTLIVPAFEFLQYKFEFPNTKSTLLKMLNRSSSTIQEFRHSIWSNGHSATNYAKWYKASLPYKVKWSLDYEPYIAVHRNVTKYDERFLGFGWNKVSHVMELYAQNYEFIVLPEAFIIHSPHSPSRDIMKYRTKREYRKCLNKLKASFISGLIYKYGERAKVFEKYYNIN